MSKTVDQRVVEMQFDNQNFERNVSTTMSTLDKLKEKLNFTGSAKGLDNLGAAAKNVNMSGLASGVELVHSRFSALEVMGVTALANITNSAVNAGKRITKALTIDPLKSGFQEYELKMGSIQTIVESTGESLETVNQYLDELNEYSDRTIYSFSDMTANIGKFTNAGVKLKDAVQAIKGVSNEAAISGANANEASRAMYNFAQALSAGYVKLIDWKSIENANMATVEFKDQLIATALEMGTVTKAADGMYQTLDGNVFNATKNFNEVFQDQWMTSEVLIETLKKYADETTEIGKKAYASAQDVKTFSMMMDTLKESIQSGWARTWEIIIGDFEQGKNLWTNISKSLDNMVSNFFDPLHNLLNTSLNGSVVTGWDKIVEYVTKAGISVEKFQNGLVETADAYGVAVKDMIAEEKSFTKTLKNGWLTKEIFLDTIDKFTGGLDEVTKSTGEASEKLQYFQKLFDEVWIGNWGNGAERIERLTKAGHDYAAVQKLVNEHTAGYKLTLEDLSDEQLKSVGYTDDQIKVLRELGEEAKRTGTPINELLESISRPTGRELLLESFSNLLEAIRKPLQAVKEAWGEVFTGINSDDIYDLIEGFRDLTESMIISDETAKNLKTLFEGLFSGWKLATGIMGQSVVATIKLLSAVLGLFGTDLVEVAAYLASYITKFAEWVNEHTLIIGMMDKVAAILHAVIEGVHDCIRAFLSLDVVSGFLSDIGDAFATFFGKIDEGFDSVNLGNFLERIRETFDKIEEWIKSLNDSKNLGRDIIEGIANGLKYGMSVLSSTLGNVVDAVVKAFSKFAGIPEDIVSGFANGIWDGIKTLGQGMVELAETLINKVCEVLGIHSPSTVFFTIGGFIISGLIGGLLAGTTDVVTTFQTIISKITEVMSNIDWGAMLIAGFGVGILLVGKKFADILDKIVSPLEHVNNVLKSVSGMFDSVSSFFKTLGTSVETYIKAASWNKKSAALKNMAIAIAILAGAVALLSILDKGSMWGAIGAIAVLATIIGSLAFVVGNFGLEETVELSKFATALLGMSASILIVAKAIKLISSIDGEDLTNGVLAVAALGGIMVGLIASTELFDKDSTKIGGTLFKMTLVLLMMVGVVKLASSMEGGDIVKGVAAVTAFGAMLAGFTAMSDLFNKDAAKLGGTLLKMAAAILLLVGIAKLISIMKTEDLIRGGIAIVAFGGIMVGLIAATSLFEEKAEKVGGTLLKMSAAILVLVVVAKLISTMNSADLMKGVIGVSAFGAIVVALVEATCLAGDKELKRVGSTILMLAVAIGILAGVSALMGLIKFENLIKGITAVSVLSGMVALLVKVTEKAQDVKGTLIGLAIAIGVLVGAIVVLSFLDPNDIAIGVTALTVLMGAFSVLVKSTESLKGVTKLTTTLLPLIGVVAILAGIVAAMTLLDTESVVRSAASISLLLISLSASMALIGKAGPVANAAVGTMALMGLVVAELGIILGMMSHFSVEASIANATALSVLLLAMSGALAILSYTAPTAMAGVGALAVMGLVVAELGVILGLMSYYDVAPSIETAGALSILLIAMSGALVLLGAVGAMGPSAFVGIGVLATLIAGIGGLIAGIGALVTEFPKLEEFLNTGIPIIEKIGYAIGSFFGNIIGGLSEGITAGLPEVAEDLRQFVSTLGMIDPAAMEGVNALSNAILTLTATNFIDSIASFLGCGRSLADFATEISGLAEPFNAFANNLGDFSEEKVESVKNAATALEVMAEAASEVNGQAEWSKSFFGDNSIVAFATEIKNFIASMAEVSTFTDDQVTSVKNAAKAVDLMADAAKGVDGQANWSKKIFGDNSITAFAEEIKSFISSMSGLGAFTDDQLSTLKNAARGIKEMAKVASDLDGQANWSKKIFGDNSLTAFAEDIKGFVSTLAELDTTVLTEFSEALEDLGESTVEEFIDGFDNADSDVRDGANGIVDEFIDEVEDRYSDFKSAGKYLVTGFADGIEANTYKAEAKARAMAKAAAKAAKKELDINSPSKVGYRIGDFFGLGFVNAVGDYADIAYKTAGRMASSASEGLKNTIGKVHNFIDMGIDTQPTITPVLDLSNVRAGAGTIGNLLTAGGPVDVLANVRSVGAMMSYRNQNGNDDIISAIDRLRRELGSVGGTSYTVNGITYDDGSAMSEAIKAIVRAAKIERRS